MATSHRWLMSTRRRWSIAVLLVAMLAVGLRADAPHVYAITKARIVTAAGPTISAGTVVVRNNVIEAVGASVSAPADAFVIDGGGLTVYPGLIDMGPTGALDVPAIAEPRTFRTREELDRWWRTNILRADLVAANYVKVDVPEWARLASSGVTTMLATPGGEIIRGQSALVNVLPPVDEPQIGDITGTRRGQVVLRSPVALHVTLSGTAGHFRPYPESLMGIIAFARQSFLDAQYHATAQAAYEKSKGGGARPVDEPALSAMRPALEGRMPVAFEAHAAREIRRALKFAAEFKLDPIITGAREAGATVADLKAQNARVIVSLNYPTKPRSLAPDADEPLSTLQARAEAPKTPGELEKGGVLFAFASAGLREPGDFRKNAARAVKAGLSADAAVRAMTINAATIAGVAERLGSIEVGKLANLIVTDGDLFGDNVNIKHVLIDGRAIALQPPSTAERRAAGQ
jgi:imidazolonepropionase-like amidohydrolase